MITITSNKLSFFYFFQNKIIQETSKEEFLPFRKTSADTVGNRGMLAIIKTTFSLFDV